MDRGIIPNPKLSLGHAGSRVVSRPDYSLSATYVGCRTSLRRHPTASQLVMRWTALLPPCGMIAGLELEELYDEQCCDDRPAPDDASVDNRHLAGDKDEVARLHRRRERALPKYLNAAWS